MKIKIVRGNIQEMDMKSAGLSVLTERGYISEELYLDLCDGDKLDRNKALGKAMIDTKIGEMDVAKIVDQDVRSYVNKFIEVNNLKPNNILEIAKDAIFIYNASPKILQFGDHVVFRCKERYFLMIEFPISESNKNPIKVYKKYAGIAIRGARIDINGDHVVFRCKERYFLMIEFPISESNKNPIKVYKKYAGIAIRGARIDINHVAYYLFLELINCVMNKKTQMYFKTLKKFIDILKGCEDNLINSVDNEHLINVFKEIII